MEAIFILSLSVLVAWLFWRYGYNSQKLQTIRRWKARYKELLAKVSTIVAVEPDIRKHNELESLYTEITETYRKLEEETDWISDAKNFKWIETSLDNVFDDAYEVNRLWNEYLANWKAFYSDPANS